MKVLDEHDQEVELRDDEDEDDVVNFNALDKYREEQLELQRRNDGLLDEDEDVDIFSDAVDSLSETEDEELFEIDLDDF